MRLVLNTDYVSLSAGDRVLQASNASFDASTFEIWGALLNGAAVVGFPKEKMLTAATLAHELITHRITTMFVTTALFHQLAREVPGVFSSVRDVLFGGEACDAATIRSVLRDRPPARLLHVYGPTETTTFATWQELTVEGTVPDTNIPIGNPIANTEVYVLDEQLRLLPVGVPGELYIGGDGVALGYWQRDELTADKFVPSPFCNAAGKLMYRSGDLVRRRPDGALEFMGRNDDQVKVRGFRIELGEIETALRSHPAVREAVVVVSGSSDRKLVAYAVPASDLTLHVQQLREFLQSRLVYYMLPSAIIVLHALPLTPNGKIDRAALPAPPASISDQHDFTEPRSDDERILATVWQEALNVARIGIHDNFFEIGGDSISVVRVAARAAKAGLSITPLQIFKHQTIAELATVARRVSETAGQPAQRAAAAEFEWSASELGAIGKALRNSQAQK
jgi:acyl-coenzyme A synthetase/AMP-(fatty) acid ligase